MQGQGIPINNYTLAPISMHISPGNRSVSVDLYSHFSLLKFLSLAVTDLEFSQISVALDIHTLNI